MELLSVSFGVFFWHTVALLCVLVVLKRFAWGTILDALEKRRAKIEESIVYAQQIEEAKRNMDLVQREQRQSLEQEKFKALDEVKAMREKLFAQIRDEAGHIKAALVKKATEEVEQMKECMKEQYSAEIAVMAIKISEQLLQRELDEGNKHGLLVDNIINELNRHSDRHA